MTQLYLMFIVNTSGSDASLCSHSSTSLDWLPAGLAYQSDILGCGDTCAKINNSNVLATESHVLH